MGRPRNNTAIDIYREFRRDVDVLLEWLNEELAATDDNAAAEPDRWDWAGDAGHVRQQLRQIVMDLSRMDVEQAEREVARRRGKDAGK